jgi:putative endonuclease
MSHVSFRYQIPPLRASPSGRNDTLRTGLFPSMERALVLRSTPAYTGAMLGSRAYYVYIMSNQSRTLYTGVTSNIQRRVWQHKSGEIDGFTHRYRIGSLVCVECFGEIHAAIAREKQIKRWRREKKLMLISQQNPDWHDLSEGWY